MACGLLLESGSYILDEDAGTLLREGTGGYLVLETGSKVLNEDGTAVTLEDVPCAAATTATTASSSNDGASRGSSPPKYRRRHLRRFHLVHRSARQIIYPPRKTSRSLHLTDQTTSHTTFVRRHRTLCAVGIRRTGVKTMTPEARQWITACNDETMRVLAAVGLDSLVNDGAHHDRSQ